MLGLFGTLDLASRSLAAQQEAMAVSGQNMANANNPAYAEEQAVIQPATPLDTTAGQEGTGVNLVSITEIRNALLDSQITAENSVTGSYSAQQSALQNAEAYLGEQLTNTSSGTSSPNGLAAGLSNLFNAFSSLSTNPTDTASIQTAIQSAQQVANLFNQVSANLSQVQSGLNSSIGSDVASSNQDLSEIASLNQQIALAQAAGQTADQLVDTRQATIENLAGIVNISTAAQSDGSVNISIGGVAMVTGGSAVDGLQTYTDAGGQTLVEDQNSSTPLSITGGSIGGNITARDGALASLQNSLNTLANQLITSVHNIYSKGQAPNNNDSTGQDLFTGTDASDIAVNPALVNDPSQFQSSASGAAGDNSIVLALAQLDDPTGGTPTLSQSYAQTVSSLGSAIATATDQLNTSQAVSTTLTNQRTSASGVNIDQEMTNLLQYQKAYEASAQLVTTLNTMMQTAVTMDNGG
ncbi:MAG: flagellar hook-associated protein FlgK [Verrucomicrobiota bacterium]|jgi:flagellar hook-associated protein 1 FlgK